MKTIHIFVILLILLFTSNCAGMNSDNSGNPVTSLELNISPNERGVIYKQPIIICFKITNLEKKDAHARNINISTKLADFFEFPSANDKLEINNGKTLAGNNKCNISSDFDNKEKNDPNDHASIDSLGKINIRIGDLAGGKRILINYSTSILKNTSRNPADVCSKIYYNDFRWDSIGKWSEPKIGNITMKEIVTQKKMVIFVDSPYNIICLEEGKCEVFKNTKISFPNDLIIKDEANTSFKDDIIDDSDESKLVNNSSYYLNTIGTHKFSGEIRHPFDIIQMDNDTYFQVIDIGDYHNSGGLIRKLILCMLLSFIVPFLIIRAMRHFKKCKDKNYIGLLLIVIILAYVSYIYCYFFACRYYQDTVILESITLSVASLALLYNYLCIITQKPCVFRWNEIPGKDDKKLIEFLTKKFDWVKAAKIEKIDADKSIKISTEEKSLSLELNDKELEVILKIDDRKRSKFIAKKEKDILKIYDRPNRGLIVLQILFMMAFTAFFHYNLPEFNNHVYAFLLAFGLINFALIFGKKETPRKLKENKGIAQAAGCILALIAIVVGTLCLEISGPIVFSPKLGLLEIMIIIFAELMPLITITITGMYYETAMSFMTLIMENSKVKNP
jgi:hypothetical protein